MTIQFTHSTIEQWAATYTGDPFHAMLCDPPYELGFMGKSWDNSGVSFKPEAWAALRQHLLPGAFIMAFASSRGWHRQAVAIEDAGYIIHPTVFGWVRGAGFPKATRIKGAAAWAGHRYGKQALKPAIEPIIVAQVPYAGKPTDSIVRTGAGAINVDAGRIGANERPLLQDLGGGMIVGATGGHSKRNGTTSLGRWPANFYLSHTDQCKRIVQAWECVPECAVLRLGEQSGESASDGHIINANGNNGTVAKGKEYPRVYYGHADSGTAARFFYNADWVSEIAERIDTADPVRYQAKAGKKERDAGLDEPCPHPTVKPLSLTRWLASLLLPPAEYEPRLLVPFAGVGSEVIGAAQAGWENVLGIEAQAEYVDIAEKRLAYWQERQTHSESQARLL